MPLPYTFANLTTAQLSYLDANFSAVGALTPIPCAVSGTNALTLTPLANTPAVSSYVNYGIFTGVVVSTNTGATTAQVNSLAALPIYKDTSAGPAALTGGELVAGNVVYLVYDAALDGGNGGFHVDNLLAVVNISGSPSAGQIAQWTGSSTLTGLGSNGTGNVVRASGAAIGTPTITGGTISGAAITSSTVAATTLQTTTAYTYSTLPAATTALRGARAYITDASVATASVGAAITGGGSNVLPVFCNGAAWVYG